MEDDDDDDDDDDDEVVVEFLFVCAVLVLTDLAAAVVTAVEASPCLFAEGAATRFTAVALP